MPIFSEVAEPMHWTPRERFTARSLRGCRPTWSSNLKRYSCLVGIAAVLLATVALIWVLQSLHQERDSQLEKRATPQNVLQWVSLEKIDVWAKCNDGSSAGFYWRESDSNSTIWIVNLEGGGWCVQPSCMSERCKNHPTLCSSRNYPKSLVMEGLLGANSGPMLRDANKVHIKYCSSDAHMGDVAVYGFEYRGARVVQAVFDDLVRHRGLGQGQQRPLIILSGQSAGGRGAMVHLDYVSKMIGFEVDVVGLLDSPLWLDIEPYAVWPGTHWKGFAEDCRIVYAAANISHLGAECMETYGDADRWKCIMGQYRMPFISTPYMLIASQYDSFQLSGNGIAKHRPSDSMKAYSETFASLTRASIDSLQHITAKTGLKCAFFSWACWNHATSLNEAGFNDFTCGPEQTTMNSAMHRFLHLEPTLKWEDTCKTFRCGHGCR